MGASSLSAPTVHLSWLPADRSAVALQSYLHTSEDELPTSLPPPFRAHPADSQAVDSSVEDSSLQPDPAALVCAYPSPVSLNSIEVICNARHLELYLDDEYYETFEGALLDDDELIFLFEMNELEQTQRIANIRQVKVKFASLPKQQKSLLRLYSFTVLADPNSELGEHSAARDQPHAQASPDRLNQDHSHDEAENDFDMQSLYASLLLQQGKLSTGGQPAIATNASIGSQPPHPLSGPTQSAVYDPAHSDAKALGQHLMEQMDRRLGQLTLEMQSRMNRIESKLDLILRRMEQQQQRPEHVHPHQIPGSSETS
ncbi:uncharacterized protein BJ171DRAFT_500670 [Polychytrium aggregatum]|uniref:uncharacterized protein n=1 Tax=Polychytrium aggregatum TaxID=110093 RepID=UPI0022FE3649|nr:uncharacterized protein BJ171DRAFT_500670 [Polychytrium aggregatum]KAI9205512.1 hypothetical protein BJ171DRAFT_500670 [Polychytrium aggregatum]